MATGAAGLRYPGPMDTPWRRRPVVRARLVVLRSADAGPEVLLVHHAHPGRQFWCFPGGGVEPGETLAEAARREAGEEVGLDVAPSGIVYVQDRRDADALDVFLLARVPPGTAATLGADPERADQPPVLGATRWVPLGELADLTVLPRGLAQRVATGDLVAAPLPDTEEGER